MPADTINASLFGFARPPGGVSQSTPLALREIWVPSGSWCLVSGRSEDTLARVWASQSGWKSKRWFEAFIDSPQRTDRKSTRLNSSHVRISYAVFCLKKKITEEWY